MSCVACCTRCCKARCISNPAMTETEEKLRSLDVWTRFSLGAPLGFQDHLNIFKHLNPVVSSPNSQCLTLPALFWRSAKKTDMEWCGFSMIFIVRSQMRHDAFCVQGAWVSPWINGAVWWWPPSVLARGENHQAISGCKTVCHHAPSMVLAISERPRRVYCRGWVWGHWVNCRACRAKTGSVFGVKIGEFRQLHIELEPLIQSSPFTSFIICHHLSPVIIFHIVLTGEDVKRCRSRSPQREPSPPVSVGPRCRSFIEKFENWRPQKP